MREQHRAMQHFNHGWRSLAACPHSCAHEHIIRQLSLSEAFRRLVGSDCEVRRVNTAGNTQSIYLLRLYPLCVFQVSWPDKLKEFKCVYFMLKSVQCWCEWVGFGRKVMSCICAQTTPTQSPQLLWLYLTLHVVAA